jgi:microcystin-dependent protein
MAIPANIIIAWSGAINEIPAGWFICDGQNDTPNLMDRFIVGAGNTYALSDTGGNADAPLIAHNHTGSLDTSSSHTHSISGRSTSTFNSTGYKGITNRADSQRSGGTAAGGSHFHEVNLANSGSTATNANLPPYYALAFIMKGAE